MVVSYSVNSVVFTHFYVSCRLKTRGYDSAAAGVAGSRPAESTQVLCLVEMSCNAWGTWRGHLHMQSYTIPFLLFLPLFSSPSVQSSTLLLEQKAPSQSFPNKQGSKDGDCVSLGGAAKPWEEPFLRAVHDVCVRFQLQTQEPSVVILWGFNLLSFKIWLSTSAHIFAYY